MSKQDTFSVAKNAGDKAFLRFIADRLVHVYGESPDVDYVLTLREFADAFEPLPALRAPAAPELGGLGDRLAVLSERIAREIEAYRFIPTQNVVLSDAQARHVEEEISCITRGLVDLIRTASLVPRSEVERLEREKAAAMGLQQGSALIIRQLEARIAELEAALRTTAQALLVDAGEGRPLAEACKALDGTELWIDDNSPWRIMLKRNGSNVAVAEQHPNSAHGDGEWADGNAICAIVNEAIRSCAIVNEAIRSCTTAPGRRSPAAATEGARE